MTKLPITIPDNWQRLTFGGRPVYLHPEKPDWFVPGAEADLILKNIVADPPACLRRRRILDQLDDGEPAVYKGRGPYLSLQGLKECWFHLTSKCNLACGHCLFSSSPEMDETLSPDLLQKGLAEARALGANLFYFTGGEPFVYPGFCEIIANLLTDRDVHAVILTNGLLLDRDLAQLAALPKERLHLQISLDGLEEHHDSLRGAGTFARLMAILDILAERGFRVTLSVAVNKINFTDLAAITELAAGKKVTNLHFLWHFIRGKGAAAQFVGPAEIFPELIKAQQVAEEHGVAIDNIEALRSQVFGSPGTRFDLSNTAWESLAIGPDGRVYPSPALVGIAALAAGDLADGLAEIWRKSPVLEKIRQASLVDSPETRRRPLKFLTGGGDLDHSYLAGGEFAGHDPYLDLYESVALWLITDRAGSYPLRDPAEIQLRMGDVRHDCPGGGDISLTHCNCVISISAGDGHRSVREFYGAAARRTNSEIINPFGPAGDALEFIPLESQSRSYGCGSPVNDADLQAGETVVDLGSGSGVECFIAAAKVGPAGRVIGIDMTAEMLALARESQPAVTAGLGYDNLEFRHGYLEDIPLADSSADVVISNCVINLSPDKRRTLHEVFRVLRPGGRLVVADIVTDRPIPTGIRNNEKLRGECLGGALQQEQLLAMLRAAGFTGAELIKRFPYRREEDTQFYSLTFSCLKPAAGDEVSVIYRGPAELVMVDGVILFKGRKGRLRRDAAERMAEAVFIVDDRGRVINNMDRQDSCCSGPPPASAADKAAAGCCGRPLVDLGRIKGM
ncbi:MAG: methyltransferase domain-containing protein [Desulfobulbales bacterium]|nr:methyltransferase domain-containing protein [Desulfobulbales bacterium]